MLIQQGTQNRVIHETTAGAGVTTRDGSVISDSLLVSLWVDSIASGTLILQVYTLTEDGKQLLLYTFPTLSAPSSILTLSGPLPSLQRFQLVATYTGICQYEVYVRAVSTPAGSTVTIANQPVDVTVVGGSFDVSIASPTDWMTQQVTVTSTPALLIASSLSDRQSLLVKNWDPTNTIYIAESLTNATSLVGYPLSARDGIAIDLAPGAAIYAVTASGTADVRIVQAGS